MNLFGKKKAAAPAKPVADPERTKKAIDTLATQGSLVDKREEHITRLMDRNVGLIKEKMAKKDKRGAMQLLKMNKIYEREREKLRGISANLMQARLTLEGTAADVGAFSALKMGAEEIGVARAGMDEEAVDDVFEKLEDQMQLQKDIVDRMAQPLGGMADEEDLSKELDSMMEEQTVATLLTAPSVPVGPVAHGAEAVPELPSAPVAAPMAAEPVAAGPSPDEERAIRELEEAMRQPVAAH